MEGLTPALKAIFESGEVLHPDAPAINPLFQRHVAGYRLALEHVRDREVLDVGIGEGYGMNMLAEVARSVTALEFTPELAEYAAAKYARPNLRVLQGRAEQLPFPDESFDVVTSFQLIEHVPEYPRFIAEARRVLRPGGVMLTVTPNRRMMLSGVNPYHFTEFDPQELGAAMRPYFPAVEVLGLFGSERYLRLKGDEQGLAKKILAWDVLNLRRRLPRALIKPIYRLAFLYINRNTDDLEAKAGYTITPEDFFVAGENLERALEAITIARKGEAQP